METAPDGTWMCTSLSLKLKLRLLSGSRELIRLSEIRADSLHYSLSLPVRINCPDPAISVPSMNSISPPTGVQASPVATPGIVGLGYIMSGYLVA